MEKLQQLSLRIHEIIFGMCLEGLGVSVSAHPGKGTVGQTRAHPGTAWKCPHLFLWEGLPQTSTWCRDPKSTSALQWGHPKIPQWLAVRGLGTLPGSRGQSCTRKGQRWGAPSDWYSPHPCPIRGFLLCLLSELSRDRKPRSPRLTQHVANRPGGGMLPKVAGHLVSPCTMAFVCVAQT